MNKLAIFGVPRSGTSWLSQIFNSHPDVISRSQPLFSYGHKGKVTPHSSRREIDEFFDSIITTQDVFALERSGIHKNYPVFTKSAIPTHICFKETRYLNIVENMLGVCPDVRIVGIVRNPLACLASWVQAPREFNPQWDINNEWRWAPSKNQGRPEEYFGFEKWKMAAESFLQFQDEFPGRFRLVRYDELSRSPLAVAQGLLEFCGLYMHPQVAEFIRASQSRHDADPYSVFRAEASDTQWQTVLPEHIVHDIQGELNGTRLLSFLASSRADQAGL